MNVLQWNRKGALGLLTVLCCAMLEPAAAETAAALPAQDASFWAWDISGELRERFESSNHPVFGLDMPAHADYVLHRAMLSAEANSQDFRMRVELASGLTSGLVDPPPTQDDPLDVLQAYIEPSFQLSGGQLALRVGRQALRLGSSRLVSVRDSPNIHRAFDGVRTTWTRGKDRSVTAFLVRPVFPKEGAFDDRSSEEQRFWGVYATFPLPRLEAFALDGYYLGLDRAKAQFAAGEAHELRHTAGARLFGRQRGWDLNIEAAAQWGSFGESSIRAWTLSLDVGFELTDLVFSPRLGLKADAISGDRNLHDARLGTFNPLFPRLPYFSEANLTTPANLLDLQPNLRLALTQRLDLTLSWNGLWKQEKADAVYVPPLMAVASSTMTRSRDVGWQASGLVEWQATQQLVLAATYVSFEPHAAIEAGRAGSYFAAWVQWTF